MLDSRSLLVIYLIYSSVCVNPKLIIDPSPSTMFLSVFGNRGLAEIFLYIKSCRYSPNHTIIHQPWYYFGKGRCCCSVAQSCPALCNSLDSSTPGFPALHCFPEPAQTHVHWVGDAIQPSHPLSSPSMPSISPSIRVFSTEWLFISGGQINGASASASVFPMNIQDWFPLGVTDLSSLAKVTPSTPQTNN